MYATLNPNMAQNGSGTLKRTIPKIGHRKDTEEGTETLVVEEYVKKFDNEKVIFSFSNIVMKFKPIHASWVKTEFDILKIKPFVYIKQELKVLLSSEAIKLFV